MNTSSVKGFLTSDEVETLNSNGPYTMGVWKSPCGQINVGNEEGLAGRSAYFVQKIRSELQRRFAPNELEQMSIIDIGCFDGWVLHQLKDMKFRKMKGVEPRMKNIQKGMVVRQILGIEEDIYFEVGDIETLNADISFDIVLCCGLMHHLDSIPAAIRTIRSLNPRFAFIECRCISSEHLTEKLRNEAELRDLASRFNGDEAGLIVSKFESSAFDGSASRLSVVNVPSVETITMNLKVSGFKDIEVLVSPQKYREEVWGGRRPLGGACFIASSDLDYDPDREQTDWAHRYERALRTTLLPEPFVYELYCRYVSRDGRKLSSEYDLIGEYIEVVKDDGTLAPLESLPWNDWSESQLELVRNLRYKPDQKIALEYAKCCFESGKFDIACEILRKITASLNADWRAFYRASYLMAVILHKLRDPKWTIYLGYATSANPRLPIDIPLSS